MTPRGMAAFWIASGSPSQHISSRAAATWLSFTTGCRIGSRNATLRASRIVYCNAARAGW